MVLRLLIMIFFSFVISIDLKVSMNSVIFLPFCCSHAMQYIIVVTYQDSIYYLLILYVWGIK